MWETLKVTVLVFFAVLMPITFWNAGQLYLGVSCDPKFGCFGVFKLLTLIVSVCAVISAFAVSAAHYIFVGRFMRKLEAKNIKLLLVGCVGLSFISGFAISLAEVMGTSILVFSWALLTFLLAAVIFKFNT